MPTYRVTWTPDVPAVDLDGRHAPMDYYPSREIETVGEAPTLDGARELWRRVLTSRTASSAHVADRMDDYATVGKARETATHALHVITRGTVRVHELADIPADPAELGRATVDTVPGAELATGDVIRHYSGAELVACRVRILDEPTAPGARRAELTYPDGTSRAGILDDGYPYERVRTTVPAGELGAVRVDVIAYAAAAALALVPVTLAVSFLASLAGAILGTLG